MRPRSYLQPLSGSRRHPEPGTAPRGGRPVPGEPGCSEGCGEVGAAPVLASGTRWHRREEIPTQPASGSAPFVGWLRLERTLKMGRLQPLAVGRLPHPWLWAPFRREAPGSRLLVLAKHRLAVSARGAALGLARKRGDEITPRDQLPCFTVRLHFSYQQARAHQQPQGGRDAEGQQSLLGSSNPSASPLPCATTMQRMRALGHRSHKNHPEASPPKALLPLTSLLLGLLAVPWRSP